MVEIEYFGHSAFRISGDGHSVMIDPFITDNTHTNVSPDSIKGIDAIILTHGHADHIGDAETIAKNNRSLIIANFEIATYMATKGLSIHSLNVGGGAKFDFGKVTLTIAHHTSSGPDGEYLGVPSGVILSIAGKTIYHAGDTGLFLDMQLIGEVYAPIDLALLPIGGNFTMDIDDAIRAAKFLNPKLTVPIHYNTWPPISADPAVFVEKVKAFGLDAKEIKPNSSLSIV